MDLSDVKDMPMKKLAVYEFRYRNTSMYLIFGSWSIYCLYQKRLVETTCFSEIVKPNFINTLVSTLDFLIC